MTVAPGSTFKGFPFASKLVVIDGGEQSAVPPLNGTKAFAPTEYSTSPEAGAEYLILPEANTPTLGLLGGSISVY